MPLVVASQARLSLLKSCPGAGQDHSPQPNHGTRRSGDLQHHAAVWEGFVLARLEPKDGEQNSHAQQDGTDDEKEENELADMPVFLDPVWLGSSCRRHGQERPLARGGWDVCVPFDGFSSSADIIKHQIIKRAQVFLTRPVLFPKSH